MWGASYSRRDNWKPPGCLQINASYLPASINNQGMTQVLELYVKNKDLTPSPED
jgi:hypothetical protein